jgi:hypothetical protein
MINDIKPLEKLHQVTQTQPNHYYLQRGREKFGTDKFFAAISDKTYLIKFKTVSSKLESRIIIDLNFDDAVLNLFRYFLFDITTKNYQSQIFPSPCIYMEV